MADGGATFNKSTEKLSVVKRKPEKSSKFYILAAVLVVVLILAIIFLALYVKADKEMKDLKKELDKFEGIF